MDKNSATQSTLGQGSVGVKGNGRRPERLFGQLADQREPVRGRINSLTVADALLKRPGSVVHELVEGRASRTATALFVLAFLTVGAYGGIMGLFSGGVQYWAVPVKVVAGAVLTTLICLPSLHIFACLSGGQQSVKQSFLLLVACWAMLGILLVGFAPVAWIFTQSTGSAAFMGFLHMIVWFVCARFGLGLLSAAFRHLNGKRMGALKVWCAVFAVVALQMMTTLRPLVGSDSVPRLREKRFFVVHWWKCLTGEAD